MVIRPDGDQTTECAKCKGKKGCCVIVAIIEDTTHVAEMLERELYGNTLQ